MTTPAGGPVPPMMEVYGRRYWGPLDRAAGRPELAQRRALRRILAANAGTTFARDHGLAEVRTLAEFRARVPVRDYDQLRSYLDRQRITGEPALTAEPPLFYAQTSGSTGTPKYVPVTAETLRLMRTEQKIFSYLQCRVCPRAFQGRAFGIMGAAIEDRLGSGHVVGSVSGHLYRSLPAPQRARFVVPPDVSSVEPAELKYLLMLRLALEAQDITYLGSPNPSTFLRLLELLNTHRHELTASLATGSVPGWDQLETPVRRAIAGRITPRPERAAALERQPTLTWANVWPEIGLVTTWTGGSCGIALDALRGLLPATTLVMELGYQATEFRGTFALEAGTPSGLPPLNHHVLEFVEQSHWDRGAPEYRALDELEPGRMYQVIVTTASGLYRYFMNDLVTVEGRYRATPLLRFVQKGRGVTNLTGEKLYEAQFVEAMQRGLRALALNSTFYLAVADEAQMAYVMYVELSAPGAAARERPSADVLARAVDAELASLNLEYRSKRESGRLALPRVVWMRPGTAVAYQQASISAGQRERQYKPTLLVYAREFVLSPTALAQWSLPEGGRHA